MERKGEAIGVALERDSWRHQVRLVPFKEAADSSTKRSAFRDTHRNAAAVSIDCTRSTGSGLTETGTGHV